ncbi:MAG: phosphoglycerate mutase family protein [Panacibacter sp.]
MKSLLIIRHAKSSWDNLSQKDFDRPLNERGHHDAPIMARRLLDKKINIDAFISSPAKRAFTTCKYFASAYGVKENKIILVPDLYEASVMDFYDAVSNVDNSFSSIAVFAHNPGVTAFANMLTNAQIDNMPTCGIFSVKAETNNWQDFARCKKTFRFFDFPKLKE